MSKCVCCSSKIDWESAEIESLKSQLAEKERTMIHNRDNFLISREALDAEITSLNLQLAEKVSEIKSIDYDKESMATSLIQCHRENKKLQAELLQAEEGSRSHFNQAMANGQKVSEFKVMHDKLDAIINEKNQQLAQKDAEVDELKLDNTRLECEKGALRINQEQLKQKDALIVQAQNYLSEYKDDPYLSNEIKKWLEKTKAGK